MSMWGQLAPYSITAFFPPPSLSLAALASVISVGQASLVLSRSVSTLSLAALDIYVFDYRGGPFAVRHWLLHLCTAVLMRPWLNFTLRSRQSPAAGTCRRCRSVQPPAKLVLEHCVRHAMPSRRGVKSCSAASPVTEKIFGPPPADSTATHSPPAYSISLERRVKSWALPTIHD